MIKKTLKYAAGVIITLLALWLSFKDLEWRAVADAFARVNLFWAVIALLSTLLSVHIIGWRWRLLLQSKTPVSLRELFRINIIGQYINIIIPARFGELLRAWLLSRRYPISGSYALGTIAIEKFVEFFIIIFLVALAPFFVTFQDRLRAHTVTLLIFALLVPLAVLTIWKRDLVRRQLARCAWLFPAAIRQRLLNFLDKGLEAFSQLKNVKITLPLVLSTLLIVLSQVLTCQILFLAFGLKLYFLEALVLQVALIIGMSIPSAPGKIGVFEYTVLIALSMFSVDKNNALGYGLVLHVIAYLPKIILGFIYMSTMNISLRNTQTELGKFQGEVDGAENAGKLS